MTKALDSETLGDVEDVLETGRLHVSDVRSMDVYHSSARKYSLLSREEELELARRYKSTGNIEARNRLVNANLRFVIKVAHEYKTYGVPIMDLVQEGNLGLINAIEKFEPEMGYRLLSYAVWWIKAYMQKFIAKNYSIVKLGNTQRVRDVLFGKRNSVEEEELARFHAMKDLSVDYVADGAKNPIIDMLGFTSPIAENAVSINSLSQLIKTKLAKVELNGREQFILEKRLMSDSPLTLEAIGEEFDGLSRERIRQIEFGLIKKLRKLMKGFDDELNEQ